MADEQLSRFWRRLAAAGWCLLAVAGAVALHHQFPHLLTARLEGARLLYDAFDLNTYFHNSRWAVGEGALYVDVESEYPPAANLLFAAVRVAAGWISPFAYPPYGFARVWMMAAWVAYVALLSRVAAHARWPVLLLFLHPAVIFFALQRFDIYPVGLTFLALAAASRDRHRAAAVWLGLAIAVKGYPLFVLPAFAVFVWRRAGARRAAVACALCLAPLVAATGIVYSYAGADGVLQPYRFHAARGLDSGGSTYDAAAQAFRWAGVRRIAEWPRAVNALQAVAALAAAGLLAVRRKEDAFAGFVAAGTFSLAALLALSPFYSPQFVLWLLPFAVFSGSLRLRVVMHVYLAATWLYFPFAHDMVTNSGGAKTWVDVFETAVFVVAVCRLIVGAMALSRLYRPPQPLEPARRTEHEPEPTRGVAYTLPVTAFVHRSVVGWAPGARNWLPVRGCVCSCASAPGGVSRHARPPAAAAYPASYRRFISAGSNPIASVPTLNSSGIAARLYFIPPSRHSV